MKKEVENYTLYVNLLTSLMYTVGLFINVSFEGIDYQNFEMV